MVHLIDEHWAPRAPTYDPPDLPDDPAESALQSGTCCVELLWVGGSGGGGGGGGSVSGNVNPHRLMRTWDNRLACWSVVATSTGTPEATQLCGVRAAAGRVTVMHAASSRHMAGGLLRVTS